MYVILYLTARIKFLLFVCLIIILACQQDYIGGILWSSHRINQLARVRCSKFHSSFRPGVFITRMCDNKGVWGTVDYSSCTMRLEAVPLLMVEVRDFDNSTDVIFPVNQVCMYKLLNITTFHILHNMYVRTYISMYISLS